MKRFLKYLSVLIFGFLIAKYYYKPVIKNHQKEEIQVVVNSVKNLSKLVVAKANFSEVYNYSDSEKYFYNYFSFDKKAIVTVTASVEVGYDLSKLEIEVDSIAKKIIINKIPKEEVVISPNVKYFDLQQSTFNTFTKETLNKINEKSIEKIKETIAIKGLKKEAKKRLIEELSKIYKLSSIYNWEVIDNTETNFLKLFKNDL